MERKNYFEMLGLEFDPVEPKEKQFMELFQEALKVWQKTAEFNLNNGVGAAKTTAAEELALKDNIIAVMSEKKTRMAEANRMCKKRIEQLGQILDILLTDQSGGAIVTRAQIRRVSQLLGLSLNHVQETYESKGFTLLKNQNKKLDVFFLPKTTLDTIQGQIRTLQKQTDSRFPWASKVQDLYDLAYYYSGKKDGDVSEYRKKRTDALLGIMSSGAVQFASDMSPAGHAICDLLQSGVSYIFNSEDNRKKYENSIRREGLADFFELIHNAPEVFKKDPMFADPCIRKIQRSFADYDLAVALYNHAAGLVQDPYEHMEARINVTCAACGTPMEFSNLNDAQKGKCSACGAALYIDCPQCKKIIPAMTSRCECGFSVTEMRFFDEYFNDAKVALDALDLTEARKLLERAKRANPNHTALPELDRLIRAEEDRHGKLIKELNVLFSANRFQEAQKKLVEIAKQSPKLNLDAQRKTITEKLNQAQKMMQNVIGSGQDAANRCVEILRIVADYSPALERLASIRPAPLRNLTAAVAGSGTLTCTLAWSASGESGVTYKVIRKRGARPVHHADGEELVSGVTSLEYRDSGIEPGVRYYYGVFACRAGSYSDPVVQEVLNLSELSQEHLQATAENGACRFSWALPKNCTGVRVRRSERSFPQENGGTILSQSAAAGYLDRDVSNDRQYGYRLQCIYQIDGKEICTPGITMMLTPEEPPCKLQQIVVTTNGTNVQVQWAIPGSVRQNVSVRPVHGSAATAMIGRVLPSTDVNSVLGKEATLGSTDTGSGLMQFVIPSNSSVSFALITSTANQSMVCDVLRASSVELCELDRLQTKIENGRLRIKLKKIPTNLDRIHYLIAEKTGMRPPWAKEQDAINGTMQHISAQQYRRDGLIIIPQLPKSDVYISVIGQYRMPDGSVVYSDVSKMRINNHPKDVIIYEMSWARSMFKKSNRASGCTLTIRCSAPETPEMRLLYRSDGHIPMRMEDPLSEVLLAIPENDPDFVNGVYTYAFSDETWASIRGGCELRLMLFEADLADFEVRPVNVANLKVPG